MFRCVFVFFGVDTEFSSVFTVFKGPLRVFWWWSGFSLLRFFFFFFSGF